MFGTRANSNGANPVGVPLGCGFGNLLDLLFLLSYERLEFLSGVVFPSDARADEEEQKQPQQQQCSAGMHCLLTERVMPF